jgi:hypothetical protein
MNVSTTFQKYPLLPALLGAALAATLVYGAFTLTADKSLEREQIATLENRIQGLESMLTQKENELNHLRSFSFSGVTQGIAGHGSSATNIITQSTNSSTQPLKNNPDSSEIVVNADQKVKDLSTRSDRDPRSIAEKINDFLAASPTQENIAIASKAVVDMAQSNENLSNDALASLYQNQTNTDIKRVVAQVLSARGDNSLIEKQINDAQTQLKDTNPQGRQKILIELAKTRHASAADTIAPLLQDADIGVKLDALLALRATGNQSHIRLAEALVNHPDPAVSWLAQDVVNSLQNLSDKARTHLASADIVAELPIIN